MCSSADGVKTVKAEYTVYDGGGRNSKYFTPVLGYYSTFQSLFPKISFALILAIRPPSSPFVRVFTYQKHRGVGVLRAECGWVGIRKAK